MLMVYRCVVLPFVLFDSLPIARYYVAFVCKYKVVYIINKIFDEFFSVILYYTTYKNSIFVEVMRSLRHGVAETGCLRRRSQYEKNLKPKL
ncbi:hypothetical protein IMSAGC022_01117 [Alistipes sp.]|nr:hypothetical protein IMSAGC022_01117 [Alistipes sp.]